ncbi:unnamed protein product [Mytilus edulis]|uniref:Fibrinogen C-terminal domain-containing protein n=1 Tax=Mytilus edulis TaxID=6550 RepID=A0A8S3R526_MYTED|nr:unnamed protein product [Mytilus edulis]
MDIKIQRFVADKPLEICSSNYSSVEVRKVKSGVICAALCVQHQSCCSSGFNKQTGECYLDHACLPECVPSQNATFVRKITYKTEDYETTVSDITGEKTAKIAITSERATHSVTTSERITNQGTTMEKLTSQKPTSNGLDMTSERTTLSVTTSERTTNQGTTMERLTTQKQTSNGLDMTSERATHSVTTSERTTNQGTTMERLTTQKQTSNGLDMTSERATHSVTTSERTTNQGTTMQKQTSQKPTSNGLDMTSERTTLSVTTSERTINHGTTMERLTTQKQTSNGPDCSGVTGGSSSGVYTIYVDNQPLDVYCEMTSSGKWTVFQRRIDGSTDFYRNWQEYKQGFGNVDSEFWLGDSLTTPDGYGFTTWIRTMIDHPL